MEELAVLETLFWIVIGLGCALFIASYFYIKPGMPVATFNPRHWKPIWKMREHYCGPGYALAKIGLSWVTGGTVALLALWIFG